MSVSQARELLADATVTREPARSKRALLVAAALGEVLDHEPIVVGGTAQDFYTGDLYRETDLDLVGWLSPDEERILTHELGFRREGSRHLYHQPANVAVELPDDSLFGDQARALRVDVGRGTVLIIAADDLYLDWLIQAAAPIAGPDQNNLDAALAVALAVWDRMDWAYVDERIRDYERQRARPAALARKLHRQVRRKVLSAT